MQYIKETLRRKILETALTEFDEKGFDGASMRAIAEGSGTSLGNLYRYFKNKDDLYQSCLAPVLVECIQLTEQTFDISETAIPVTAFYMAEYVVEHPREFRVIVRGPAKHYSEFRDHFRSIVARSLRDQAEKAGIRGVKNPGFYDAVALAFISSLREIMENGECINTEAHVQELMRFMFSDFDARLKKLEGAAV